MEYKNASDLLPHALLSDLQKYCEGCIVYIPKKGEKLDWGAGSGAKRRYEERNRQISKDRSAGLSIKELSEKYFLTEDGIRKILRKK